MKEQVWSKVQEDFTASEDMSAQDSLMNMTEENTIVSEQPGYESLEQNSEDFNNNFIVLAPNHKSITATQDLTFFAKQSGHSSFNNSFQDSLLKRHSLLHDNSVSVDRGRVNNRGEGFINGVFDDNETVGSGTLIVRSCSNDLEKDIQGKIVASIFDIISRRRKAITKA